MLPLIDVLLLAEDGDSIPPIDTFATLCADEAGTNPEAGLRPWLCVPVWLDSLSEAIMSTRPEFGACMEEQFRLLPGHLCVSSKMY